MTTKTIKNDSQKLQVYYVDENPIELKPGEEYTYEERERQPESVGISVAETLRIDPSMGTDDSRKKRMQQVKGKPDQEAKA